MSFFGQTLAEFILANYMRNERKHILLKFLNSLEWCGRGRKDEESGVLVGERQVKLNSKWVFNLNIHICINSFQPDHQFSKQNPIRRKLSHWDSISIDAHPVVGLVYFAEIVQLVQVSKSSHRCIENGTGCCRLVKADFTRYIV